MPSYAAIPGRISCLASQEARRALQWRERNRIGEAQECERFGENLAGILADATEPASLPPTSNPQDSVREVRRDEAGS